MNSAPLELMDLPDEMIQKMCEGMPISDLKSMIRTTTRVRKLCHSILVEKRRWAFGVLSANHIDISTRALRERAFFDAAGENNQLDVVRAMLVLGMSPNTTSKGRPALHEAAVENNEEIVLLLLSSGANIKATDTRGVTAIFDAAKFGYDTIVKILLDAGANINDAGKDGRTALHIAAINGSIPAVKVLLRFGANPNAVDNKGLTVVRAAGYTENGREIKRMLKEAGAR